jgi:TatD DNase family protein
MKDFCFIDIHCHLDLLEDIDAVVERARKKDVGVIVTQGINIETNKKALELAEEFKEVKVALGLYPSECVKLNKKEIDAEIAFIRKNAGKIAAIGEVGLDLKELDSLERQSAVFQSMIELALELNVPVIVHSRNAELECIEFLENLDVKKVIMHCFGGKLNLVRRIVKNGWSLSIPASVKNSTHFQEIVKIVPLQQLLCETDSPYLHPDKKFPNEPMNILISYKKIAEIKGLSLVDVQKQIFKNYQILF